MKLEVGMYVRTERGYIAKCTYIDKEIEGIYGFDGAIRKSFGDEYDFIYIQEHDITKASRNIIDLIEAGDYVNGKLVSSLPLFKNEFIFDEPVNGVKYIKGIVGTPIEDNKDNFIKSIVTKEMFESMSYKVGD